MLNFYNDITTPEELLDFMNNNFSYGYVDKDDIKHNEFASDWFDKFILQTQDDMLKSKVGCCFDAVELERSWFQTHGYEFKTIFEMVKLDYPNNYPMHTFLVYKKNGFWYYFEWADFLNRGIYQFKTLNEALDYQFYNYLKRLDELNITGTLKEKIIRKTYLKPMNRPNAIKYLNFVIAGEDI